MELSRMARAGRGSRTSSRMMATECRWHSLPRPRTPTIKSTQRPQSMPWAGRLCWSVIVMAGPSSPRPEIIQTLQLVYIAAFALDEGESCASIETALPQASKAFKSDSNGLWWIDEAHFVADFAAD